MQRHDLDVLSLFAGLLFVAIAVVGLTDAVTLSVADLRWLGPAALVAFGIVLVATAGGRRSTEPTAAATADTAHDGDMEPDLVSAGDHEPHRQTPHEPGREPGHEPRQER